MIRLEVLSIMTQRASLSFLAISLLSFAPAAFGAEHGGAIPPGLSYFESPEFSDVQMAASREAEPVWGSLILDGTTGMRFLPDNGLETKVAYSQITAFRYERVVSKKEKLVNPKWYQRPLAFARGVDTYRTVTVEHQSAEGKKTSILRVDALNATGIVRMLEIKTGLRVKKLSNL
jgi:hypothetical protein